MTVSELARLLSCRLDGDGAPILTGVAGIAEAGPTDLTFVAHPKYLDRVRTSRAGAIVIGLDATVDTADGCPPLLRGAEPAVLFARAIPLILGAERHPTGVHPTAIVPADATIADGVALGAYAVIGHGAAIGARTVVYPHVVIGDGVVIGADCVLHAHVSVRGAVRLGDRVIVEDGALIGGEGFGFARAHDGTHVKIPQRGSLVIEDDVEIGAHTVVDRPAVGATVIGAGTKVDNLVQIAHGVQLGRRAILASQVGIAGSCTIDDDVVLAGQVGVADHVHIGRGALATAQTGIPNDVDAGAKVSGYPAVANREWLKSSAVVRQLPAMKKRLHEVDDRIARLEAQWNAWTHDSQP